MHKSDARLHRAPLLPQHRSFQPAPRSTPEFEANSRGRNTWDLSQVDVLLPIFVCLQTLGLQVRSPRLRQMCNSAMSTACHAWRPVTLAAHMPQRSSRQHQLNSSSSVRCHLQNQKGARKASVRTQQPTLCTQQVSSPNMFLYLSRFSLLYSATRKLRLSCLRIYLL